MNYSDFISQKGFKVKLHGIDVDPSRIHPSLFPFQRDATLWSLRKGRVLVGLDTGLGKSRIQLEWLRLLIETDHVQRGLIVAPLSVARQTVKEAARIDMDLRYVRDPSQIEDNRFCITNYEMVERFDPSQFGAVALDESSILKAIAGKTRQFLTSTFANVPYRSCYTATPAPNDDAEIGMHSEYLGINTNHEMLSMFFINANRVVESAVTLSDGRVARVQKKQGNKHGQEWRLRNYGKQRFYEWLSSWALMMSKPSDLGYDDTGYDLPSLNIMPLFVDTDYVPEGQLFFTGLKGIQDRTRVRRSTLKDRLSLIVDRVNSSDEQWICWCGLDAESEALAQALTDSHEVRGSDSPEHKANMLEGFQDGLYRVLITKPKIAGFGMNFQNAHNMAFVGLGDSWESYYQCIRREWRFGQSSPVNVFIILSEIEREIYANVMRKEAMAAEMKRELIKNVQLFEQEELGTKKQMLDRSYLPSSAMTMPNWL